MQHLHFISYPSLKLLVLKKRARAEAASDYLRSISSEIELLQKRPLLMKAAISKF